jgi:hypothetical protein
MLLSDAALRVLGTLMEKQLATPEYYPMTLNALTAGCNQKSSRLPVVHYRQEEVEDTLALLDQEALVARKREGRVERYDQRLSKLLDLHEAEQAVMTLLMLRGPQTVGELRTRSDRLYPFESLTEVQDILHQLARRATPLIRKLPRREGQKEARFAHTLSETDPETAYTDLGLPAPPPEMEAASLKELTQRVSDLEQECKALRALLVQKGIWTSES